MQIEIYISSNVGICTKINNYGPIQFIHNRCLRHIYKNSKIIDPINFPGYF